MIGVYGGTFDPVHYGHLRTALEVKELFGLNEVRLIPCKTPPHRAQPMASPKMRLQMLHLAVEAESGLVVDTRELDRDGPSFMVDTLNSIRAEEGSVPIFLFIGSDAFNYLTHWHEWEHLFDFAHIVVMSRPGTRHSPHDLNPFFKTRYSESLCDLKNRPFGALFFQEVTRLDISATQIRRVFSENRNPRFLLPDPVIDFINQNRLYVP